MWHRLRIIGLITFSTLLVLAGMRFIAAPAFASSPDIVHIVVTDMQLPLSQETVIFDHQFSRQASAVYRQLLAGRQITSSDAQSCPSYTNQQPYYHYELTFFHMGINVATAVSDARGCADITVRYFDGSTKKFFWATDNHVSIWVELHQLVNAPEPINTCIGIDSRGSCISIPAS